MARFIRWPVGTPPFQRRGTASGGRGSSFGGNNASTAGAPDGWQWTRAWQEAFERNNQFLEQLSDDVDDLEVTTRRTGRLDNDDKSQIFQLLVGEDIQMGLRICRGFHPETQVELFTYAGRDRNFQSSSDLTGFRLG